MFFSRILFSFILKRWVNKVQKIIKRKRDTDSYGNPNGHTSFSDKNDLLSDPRLTFLSDRIDVEVKTFIHNFIKVF